MLHKPTKALSLFDGMSCGQIALKESGFNVVKYYASEIDKHAIQVTQHNFPNTIQLGDVTKWREWNIEWTEIDILLAGSPCQGFSFAGKQLAFDDPRSALFFVFVEILQHLKKHNPKAHFLLENVKMKREHELVISRYMGVHPIEINSALLSAQNRVRLYWTSIANEPYGLFGDLHCTIPQPKDKGILLKDILETDVPEKYYVNSKNMFDFVTDRWRQEKKYTQINGDKAITQQARQYSSWCGDYITVASRGRNPENPNGKTNCLTSVQKDNYVVFFDGYEQDNREYFQDGKSGTLDTKPGRQKVIQINPSKESGGKQPYQQNRVYSTEGKMTCLDTESGKKNILIPEATKKGYAEVKPGECFDLTMPDSETRRGRLMEEKSNCLTASKFDFMQYTQDYKIRRLTPTECARLQTIPDWYDMSVVSDTQRYRMLGNGWTVAVITHILSYHAPQTFP